MKVSQRNYDVPIGTRKPFRSLFCCQSVYSPIGFDVPIGASKPICILVYFQDITPQVSPPNGRCIVCAMSSLDNVYHRARVDTRSSRTRREVLQTARSTGYHVAGAVAALSS